MTSKRTYDQYYYDFVEYMEDLKECQIKGTDDELKTFTDSVGNEQNPSHNSCNEFTVPFGVILPIEVTKKILITEDKAKPDVFKQRIQVDLKNEDVVQKQLKMYFEKNPERYVRFNEKYSPQYKLTQMSSTQKSFDIKFRLKGKYQKLQANRYTPENGGQISSLANKNDPNGMLVDQQKDLYDKLKALLVNLQTMGDYGDDTTPLDQYDSKCHATSNGIASQINQMSEEDLIFMINLSEQTKRPQDMLMFLGEYLKETIQTCDTIFKNISNDDGFGGKGKTQQENFFLSMQIINSLGTACKKLLESHRQELRIAIALSRNPRFQDKQNEGENVENESSSNRQKVQKGDPINTVLRKGIMVAQMKVIITCFEIYRYIDFIHDRKKYVPQKQQLQPAKYLIDAHFYKMKSDYMKFIFETLDCENGLLYNQADRMNFGTDMEKLLEKELTDESHNIESQIDLAGMFKEEIERFPGQNFQQPDTKEKNLVLKFFKSYDMTVLEFMYYLTYFEYEKAKRCIFDEKNQQAEHKEQLGQTSEDGSSVVHAEFHPILLSSLLNQQTFKRDYYISKYQKALVDRHQNVDLDTFVHDESKIHKKRHEQNYEIIKYVKNLVNLIELHGYLQRIVHDDERNVAQNIMELLEKSIASWDEKENL